MSIVRPGNKKKKSLGQQKKERKEEQGGREEASFDWGEVLPLVDTGELRPRPRRVAARAGANAALRPPLLRRLAVARAVATHAWIGRSEQSFGASGTRPF